MDEVVIVLITEGKNESVDYATVRVFPNKRDALYFCKENTTGRQKYWKACEIVGNGERMELCRPEYDEDDING